MGNRENGPVAQIMQSLKAIKHGIAKNNAEESSANAVGNGSRLEIELSSAIEKEELLKEVIASVKSENNELKKTLAEKEAELQRLTESLELEKEVSRITLLGKYVFEKMVAFICYLAIFLIMLKNAVAGDASTVTSVAAVAAIMGICSFAHKILRDESKYIRSEARQKAVIRWEQIGGVWNILFFIFWLVTFVFPMPELVAIGIAYLNGVLNVIKAFAQMEMARLDQQEEKTK